MPKIGTAHGRIELDEDVSGLHALAVLDMDGAYNAGLKRLDNLSPAARNDLARGHGDDIDRTQAGPGQSNTEHGNDRCADRPTDRRRRRLDNLESRRQESNVILIAVLGPLGRKGDDLLSGLHIALPG